MVPRPARNLRFASHDAIWGGAYIDQANLVVFVAIDTWLTEDRWTFLTLHLVTSGNQVTGFMAALGGDLDTQRDDAIVLAKTDQENAQVTIESYRAPTPSRPGFIAGTFNGVLRANAPDGSVVYAQSANPFVFHVPVYFDD